MQTKQCPDIRLQRTAAELRVGTDNLLLLVLTERERRGVVRIPARVTGGLPLLRLTGRKETLLARQPQRLLPPRIMAKQPCYSLERLPETGRSHRHRLSHEGRNSVVVLLPAESLSVRSRRYGAFCSSTTASSPKS